MQNHWMSKEHDFWSTAYIFRVCIHMLYANRTCKNTINYTKSVWFMIGLAFHKKVLPILLPTPCTTAIYIMYVLHHTMLNHQIVLMGMRYSAEWMNEMKMNEYSAEGLFLALRLWIRKFLLRILGKCGWNHLFHQNYGHMREFSSRKSRIDLKAPAGNS